MSRRPKGGLQRRHPRTARAGFTLVEVLLVLLILVALVAFVGLPLMSTQQDALKKNAKIQTGAFENSLKFYFMDLNQYPTTAEGLQALIEPPPGLKNPAKWKGYLDKGTVPVDPWENPYQYAYPGLHNPSSFDVWSLGPDGQDGTGDEVGNWSEQ